MSYLALSRRVVLTIATVAAVGVAATATALADDHGGDGKHTTTCTGTFSGTAENLLVPAGQTCLVSAAQIKHDVTVQADGSLAIERSTVGHDIIATKPQNIETGFGASVTPGPVSVGHDVSIVGSDAPNAVGYDICDTSVGHDLLVADTQPQFEIDIGDVGPQLNEFCSYAVSAPDRVGHDLLVYRNSPLTLDVGNNRVGHALVVADNTAKTSTDVSDNQVGHDAVCSGNTPPPSPDGPEDGPNQAGHNNGCP